MTLPLRKPNSVLRRSAICTWAEEDRPREKMIQQGAHALTDTELLAILLRSGNHKEDALVLAQRMLASVNYNLRQLAQLGRDQLESFSGIGQAKAVTIMAALELGRRRQLSRPTERPQITTCQLAYEYLAATLTELAHEECWMLCLNRASYVLKKVRISIGGVSGTVVDPKIVFRKALEFRASAIIIAHNHPSGRLEPSREDIRLTEQLETAGRAIAIPLYDHLIIADGGYYSFTEHQLIDTQQYKGLYHGTA